MKINIFNLKKFAHIKKKAEFDDDSDFNANPGTLRKVLVSDYYISKEDADIIVEKVVYGDLSTRQAKNVAKLMADDQDLDLNSAIEMTLSENQRAVSGFNEEGQDDEGPDLGELMSGKFDDQERSSFDDDDEF